MLAKNPRVFLGETLHVVDRAVKIESLQTFSYPVTYSAESV